MIDIRRETNERNGVERIVDSNEYCGCIEGI